MTEYIPEKPMIKLILALTINTVRLVLYPIAAAVLSIPLLFAWNHVMPDFGLPELTYLKTLCLLLVVNWIIPTRYIPINTAGNDKK